MITIADGRKELYQWDTSRTVEYAGVCSQFHFSNQIFGRTVDVDAVQSDGKATAKIPDFLLQSDSELKCYVYSGTDIDGYTKVEKSFRVNRRNKPADYVFTPDEQQHISDAKEYAEFAKKSAEEAKGYTESVKADAEKAQSAANRAESSASIAQENGSAAKASAESALNSKTSAEDSAESALNSKTFAEAAVKESAVSAENALKSEQSAKQSAESAKADAEKAMQASTNAKVSETKAQQSSESAWNSKEQALESAAAAKQSEGNAKLSEDSAGEDSQKAMQALSDLLRMLGTDIATLVNGKIPVSQIPSIATTEIFVCDSQQEEDAVKGAENGDILIRTDLAKSYIRKETGWVYLVSPTDYAAKAGYAETAKTAENANAINGHRLVQITYEEWQTAVKDPDTYYLIYDPKAEV